MNLKKLALTNQAVLREQERQEKGYYTVYYIIALKKFIFVSNCAPL